MMTYTTLISVSELASHLNDPDWAIVDCRFSLVDPGRGRQDFLRAHIPGAVFADLDKDLRGQVIPGRTGRHPLPEVGDFVKALSGWGIDERVQVVTYDDTGGALPAARLWWMLRWLGHPAAAVLDGGWQAWAAEKLPVKSGDEQRAARHFTPHLRPDLLVKAGEVEAIRQNPDNKLLDARAPERYRGENETIDPVAGHIPGAISAPYQDLYTKDGRLKKPEELRVYFQGLLGSTPADKAVFYCGSGVTAAADILGVAHAGLGEARLYAGSWSEWITDPKRPRST